MSAGGQSRDSLVWGKKCRMLGRHASAVGNNWKTAGDSRFASRYCFGWYTIDGEPPDGASIAACIRLRPQLRLIAASVRVND
jgi:hypothetical protein